MSYEIKRNILSQDICKRLIKVAENNIDKTTLDTVDKKPTYEYHFNNLHDYCDVSGLLQLISVNIKKVDYWIRQYVPNGRNSLNTHLDTNSQTINIALNSSSEYTGNGLHLVMGDDKNCINSRIYPNMECGDALIHSNDLYHGVGNILTGVRWTLIIFINSGIDYYMKDLDTKIKYYDRSAYKNHIESKIMSHNLCDKIVEETKKHKWTKKRHLNYPTTDIPVKIMNISVNVNNFVKDNIFPYIEKHYGIDKQLIKINDLFVVKYNVSEQNFLERHTDGSVYSFNILLNERVDFDGGGTGIYAPWNYEECHISKGDLVIHPGFLYHKGITITRGVRYILVGFLGIRKYVLNQDITILSYNTKYNEVQNNPRKYISDILNTQIDNLDIIETGVNKRFTKLDDNIILLIIPKNKYSMKINNFLINDNIVLEKCNKIKWQDQEEFEYVVLKKNVITLNSRLDNVNNGILLINNLLDNEKCKQFIEIIDKTTQDILTKSKYNKLSDCISFKSDEMKQLDNEIHRIIGKIFSEISCKQGIRCTIDNGYVLKKNYGQTQLEPKTNEHPPFNYNSFYNMNIIITLNDDYEGGEIYFPGHNLKMKLMKGQVIAFPPYWTHKYMFYSTKNNTYRYTINTLGGIKT